jgi:hypothetical protein
MKANKLSLAVFILAVCLSARAGDYYSGFIDDYDSSSGLYYKSVIKKTDSRGVFSSASDQPIVNVAIFDPASGATKTVFTESINGVITTILFESGFRDGSIQFNGGSHAYSAKNNTSVAKREPRDKLLIAVRKPGDAGSELLVSDKRGRNVVRVAVVPQGANWHIDVGNSKIRVVSQVGTQIKIESVEW